jgi:hypothetical protein
VILVALYVVGAVSVPPGSLRHEVQTLPLWLPIVAGFGRRVWTKWVALPCMILWLLIIIAIWLFLLGFARIVTGHFFPTELAMTLVIGAASVIGIATSLRQRSSVRPVRAVLLFAALTVLQVAAFRLSLLPYIATR